MSYATQLLRRAQSESRGIGAFNVIQIEHAQAYAAAAQETGCPMILQISQNTVKYHGDLAPIGRACLAIAEMSDVPLVVHLDHAVSRALVTEAIELGFTSVMYDGSAMPYQQNLEVTAEVVAEAHAAGVAVEAELGEIGGKDGVHAPGARTDPAEALAFVKATGVDSLAVAVGTSHAMEERTAMLDLHLIKRLRDALNVPLVLHGSSGVPDETLRDAIAAGIAKVNISTLLNRSMTERIRSYLLENPSAVDPRKFIGAGRQAITEEVIRLLDVLGTAENYCGRGDKSTFRM